MDYLKKKLKDKKKKKQNKTMLSNSMLFEIETFYHPPTLHDVLMFVFVVFLRLNKPIARRKRQFKHFDFNNGEKFEKKDIRSLNAS
jgi:hypothetical protein